MNDSDDNDAPIPQGPVTKTEVMGGIRRLAYGASSETVSLRAWELMGKDIGMFRDSPSDGGAPVVRLTPALDIAPALDVAPVERSERDDVDE